jgi:long-chain acyl-CoA synthetase
MRPGSLALTFNQRFEEVAGQFPDRVAFRLKTTDGYQTYTYREACNRTRAVAAGLLAMGVQSGTRVAILSENRPEWVIAYLGIFFSGGTVVPLDAQLSSQEWRRLIDDSESRIVFVSGLLLPKLREAVGDCRPPCFLICFDEVTVDQDSRTSLHGFIGWAESQNPGRAVPTVDPSDLATIIYTSGTTGKPKGVMLTHSNIFGEVRLALQCVRVDESDALLCLLPLQHVLASIVNVLIPLSLGAQVVFADTLKRSEILEALQQAGITVLATVPQFFYLFHDRIRGELDKKPLLIRRLFRGMQLLNRFSLRLFHLNMGKQLFGRIHATFGSRLRLFVSGASSFDPKVAQDFHDFGFTILQGYGLTETSGGCTLTRIESNVIGSVGTALPEVDVVIDAPDQTGVGEVLIRGPIVMKGYYRNPEATAEALAGGWLHSGDLGRMDAQGNLFITGRKKEVIVLPNGKNIYPDELETHYLQSPYIQEIAVVGVSEPGGHETSERLHAVVVPNFDNLKAKKIANTKEILRDEIGRLSNQLPKYKRLMSYQIQKDPLPRTTTRKIKRLELKRLIESGRLAGMENSSQPSATLPENQRLLDTAVGQEVLTCLRESYHRDTPIDPAMNLELDLGFDSMERVELLASLEQTLNLRLPEDFGTEVFTVRDLIVRLEQLAGVSAAGSAAERQSWKSILSEESLQDGEDWRIHFSGTALSLLKWFGLRFIYFTLFRTFLRLEVHGKRQLPRTAPYLICPNHLSYIDPFLVMSVLPFRIFRRVFFVGYSEYFDNWFMKLLARLTNTVPVDPDAHLLRAMKVGAYGLRHERILCIFPEGGRSFDGELQQFKKGAAILAREIGVSIIPVGIQGAYEVWPRGSKRIRPHKVRMVFGPALLPVESGNSDPYQLDTERIRAAVAGLIGGPAQDLR